MTAPGSPRRASRSVQPHSTQTTGTSGVPSSRVEAMAYLRGQQGVRLGSRSGRQPGPPPERSGQLGVKYLRSKGGLCVRLAPAVLQVPTGTVAWMQHRRRWHWTVLVLSGDATATACLPAATSTSTSAGCTATAATTAACRQRGGRRASPTLQRGLDADSPVRLAPGTPAGLGLSLLARVGVLRLGLRVVRYIACGARRNAVSSTLPLLTPQS